MKTTLKFLRFIPAIALLLVWGCEMESNEVKDLEEQVSTDVLVMDYNARRPDPSSEFPTGTLVAGQTMDVGTVKVNDDGTTITVTYTTNSDWCLSEIHVHVANVAENIPQGKNGNPKIGNFAHVAELNECTYTYTAEFNSLDFDDCFFVAAHAVVKDVIGYESDLDPVELPDQVSISVNHPGGDSYFNTTVSGGSILDGVYDGWCIDTDRTIYSNRPYTANVLSSYEDIPDGLLEFPENLDLINWIINQDFVGKTSTCGGSYTYGDVQRAIWSLIEDSQSPSGLGSWEQCRVDEILGAAEASGEYFMPGCGDQLAIILVPVNPDDVANAQITIAQITIIDKEVFCTPIPGDWEETAWGSGDKFTHKGSWAMYSNSCDY